MRGIMTIVKSFKDCGLLIKVITQTIENETKDQRGEFHGMLLSTIGENLLGNMLAGREVIRAFDLAIRAGQDF